MRGVTWKDVTPFFVFEAPGLSKFSHFYVPDVKTFTEIGDQLLATHQAQ